MRYSNTLYASHEKPMDPVLYAYRAMLNGEDVQPVRMSAMVKTYVIHREIQIVGQMCEKLGQIAIASPLLTRRQRQKYADNRIEAGRKVFYLFRADHIPADIGATVKIEEGLPIYL